MAEKKDKVAAEPAKKTNAALDAVLSQIKKEFGELSIMRLGGEEHANIPVISTGALSLDLALGVGGLPRGRIVECYGQESSGKTTLALHVVANAQKAGGVAAFIDAEHALDPGYAKKIGVNLDDLLVAQPNSGEEALSICEQLCKSGALDVIVVDSVAALTPQAEIDGNMGDSHMGLQARLMSQAMRKLTGVLNQTKTLCIFTNQVREKIGVMFGNPETTTGGRALKFYASIRMEIRKGEAIKSGGDVIGNRARVKVVKNKVAPPFKHCEFDIMYGTGISREGTVLDLGTSMDIIEKSGTWYSYKGERLGQGKENVKIFMKEHPEITDEVEKIIRDTLAAEPEKFDEAMEEEDTAALETPDTPAAGSDEA